jgi:hypothetical protein
MASDMDTEGKKREVEARIMEGVRKLAPETVKMWDRNMLSSGGMSEQEKFASSSRQAEAAEGALIKAAMAYGTTMSSQRGAAEYAAKVSSVVAEAAGLEPQEREKKLGLALLGTYEDLGTVVGTLRPREIAAPESERKEVIRGMRQAANVLMEGYASPTASKELKAGIDRRVGEEAILSGVTSAMSLDWGPEPCGDVLMESMRWKFGGDAVMDSVSKHLGLFEPSHEREGGQEVRSSGRPLISQAVLNQIRDLRGGKNTEEAVTGEPATPRIEPLALPGKSEISSERVFPAGAIQR